MTKTGKKLYYHFTSDTLRDGKPLPKVGKWIQVKGAIVTCKNGLHASEHPFDALQYAPACMLHLVELGGEVVEHGTPVDKVAARKRKIVASIDTTDLCRTFARRCALDVLHLWPTAPRIVKDYLSTGDESLGDAAWDAARAVAWDDAGDAAGAAGAAARDAAWAAARGTAWYAVRAAAGDAEMDKYRQWFKEMVDQAFESKEQGTNKQTPLKLNL